MAVIIWYLVAAADPSTTGIDPITAISQLGIGALIAAPFAYMWRSVRADAATAEERHNKELAAKDLIIAGKDLELRDRGNEMYRRERDLNDAALPRLSDAVTTLRETQRGMGDALRSQGQPTGQEVAMGELVRQLQAAVATMGEVKRREQ